MTKNTSNFINQNYNLFINSFKRINLKIFLILIADILFYFIVMQVGNFFVKQILARSDKVDLTQNILDLGAQGANQLLSSVKGFFFFVIFSAILFVILMIINLSVFKGLIWSITANKKFNLYFFKKFLLLNLIWLPIWVFLIFLFAIAIKQTTAAIFMLITIGIAVYLTNILYPLFLKENKTNKIKEALKLGIKKIHYFIVPYAIIIILMYTISRLYNLITININLHQNVYIGLLLIFIAWVRYYIVEIVDSVE